MLWPHISIEEINSLSDEEKDMLLYICNVWAPIRPPVPTEENPHPITLSLIRASRKQAIIDRVIQACKVISPEGKEVYNGLRSKLGLPVPEPEPKKEEILSLPPSGSNVQ